MEIMEIKRDLYLNELISHKHNGLIKIVSGIRRCGKSYLLFELFKKHLISEKVDKHRIIAIALDDFAQIEYRDPKKCYNYVKSRIKDSKMHYLLLDEVQLMDNFQDVLNGFLHIKNLDVYVTGSNSKFLSSDVVTEFRGRGDEIRVYPLSFSEFYSVTGGDWYSAWQQYYTFGGMPMVLNCKTQAEKNRYLSNLFKETYLKDIIERNHVKTSGDLEELLSIIASNIGSLTNPKKLSDTFNSVKKSSISAPTIKQYLDYFQDSFLISKAVRYDIKGKRYISTPLKYYFCDMGLRNALLNFRQIEATHIMENVIFNELNIRGYAVDVGEVVLWQKNKNNKFAKTATEVDFVVNNASKRYYIQSSLEMPTNEKLEQEERSLLAIKDAFRKIIIVERDILPQHDNNGVSIIGLKDFLLNKNSLEL